ncbi:MAG TPA: hypothetical protein DIS90_01320 [Cytophagales bacterium]|nr:hypothetical protein [Cytophagales bacterium]HCR54884.1 hypothetical protein [Cytophagales bacterium]
MSGLKSILSALFIIVLTIDHFGQEAKVWVQRDDNKIVIRNNNGLSSFDVELRGKIVLTDDDKDIKSMSPDGYLEVKKTVFGSRRTLIVMPEGNGLRKDYYEGRTKIAFEPSGRAWMAEILPELVRTTTIGAEGRVERFFKKGGPTAVLNEIDNLGSNYVKAKYADILMKESVNPRDYARIIDKISGTMNSNYYLAGFLKNNMDKFIKSNEAMEATFRATNNMDSDHYKTEVIKKGLDTEFVSINTVKIIMKSAGSMDSDHYKTEVLSSLLRKDNLNDEIIGEMINTSKTIDSDYYRSVVLNRALSKNGLSNTSFQKALESIGDIDSDHYKSEVLTSLLRKPISDDLQKTLITITKTIDSDHYCSLVLEEMLQKQTINDQVFEELITRAGAIDSDHYATLVMKDALSHPLSDKSMINLLKAASRIGSDHYLSDILSAAAPKIRNANDSVKEAFNSAARQIDSETYYGRVMRALNNN